MVWLTQKKVLCEFGTGKRNNQSYQLLIISAGCILQMKSTASRYNKIRAGPEFPRTERKTKRNFYHILAKEYQILDTMNQFNFNTYNILVSIIMLKITVKTRKHIGQLKKWEHDQVLQHITVNDQRRKSLKDKCNVRKKHKSIYNKLTMKEKNGDNKRWIFKITTKELNLFVECEINGKQTDELIKKINWSNRIHWEKLKQSI